MYCSREHKQQNNMHEWLSGGVSPCQGEGRGFESRLVLFRSFTGYCKVFCCLCNIGTSKISFESHLRRFPHSKKRDCYKQPPFSNFKYYLFSTLLHPMAYCCFFLFRTITNTASPAATSRRRI